MLTIILPNSSWDINVIHCANTVYIYTRQSLGSMLPDLPSSSAPSVIHRGEREYHSELD